MRDAHRPCFRLLEVYVMSGCSIARRHGFRRVRMRAGNDRNGIHAGKHASSMMRSLVLEHEVDGARQDCGAIEGAERDVHAAYLRHGADAGLWR